MKPQRNRDGASSTATLGFESQLWAAADALRGSMDAAEDKHDVKPFNICYGET
jgi:type I restriction enzyme M protein